jgi:hypothetical protein
MVRTLAGAVGTRREGQEQPVTDSFSEWKAADLEQL